MFLWSVRGVPATSEPLIQDMGHVIVLVADMDRALAFYRDLLGFNVVGSVHPVWTVVTVPEGQLTLWKTEDVAVVALGPEGEGTPLNFHVADFSRVADVLDSRGVRVKRESPHSGIVWDPFGNVLGMHDHRDER